MENLPDYLHLSDTDVAREKSRQDQLRRDFFSRARQSPAEDAAARAMVLEESLRTALLNAPDNSDVADRLADNLAAQGRFIEATEIASSPEAKEFYQKTADAVYDGTECDCGDTVAQVGADRIALPSRRVLKEIYSLKTGSKGYLIECGACKDWMFSSSDPTPPQNTEFNPHGPNDIDRYKI